MLTVVANKATPSTHTVFRVRHGIEMTTRIIDVSTTEKEVHS